MRDPREVADELTARLAAGDHSALDELVSSDLVPRCRAAGA